MPKTHFPAGGANDKAILNSFYNFPGHVGNVFFVDSNTGSSTGPGFSPENPYATIDQAVGACTANNGDHIVVMPNHAESLGAAGAIACDVAGITIIGLGYGNRRPTITWHTTDATWTVSAANVRIHNIRCTVDVDEVVKLFSVTAAGAILDTVDFFETASAQAIQFLLTNASADDLEICNCRHFQVNEAGGSQVWISLIGADRAWIHDNTFILKLADVATSCVIGSATTAPKSSVIERNNILMTGYTANLVSAIIGMSAHTGLCVNNRIAADVAAVTTINDFASGYSAENYCLNTVDKSGILDPVADS